MSGITKESPSSDSSLSSRPLMASPRPGARSCVTDSSVKLSSTRRRPYSAIDALCGASTVRTGRVVGGKD
jgi:hypothetical protein